jgi:hypothetical protein
MAREIRKRSEVDFLGALIRRGKVLAVHDPADSAGIVHQIRVGVDPAIDDGNANAPAIEAGFLRNIGANGGDGVL